MNVASVFLIEPIFFCLIFLPLPVLAALLMRSDCRDKKVLLQLLFLIALESLGHGGGALERAITAVLASSHVPGMMSAYAEIAIMIYRGAMQVAVSLFIWKNIQPGRIAGILLLLLFLPGLFLHMWTTCAMAVTAYSLCIRGLLRKRGLSRDEAGFLGVVACVCVVITGVGDYQVNSSVNRQIAENMYVIGGSFLNEEDQDFASMYLGDAVRREPRQPYYLRDYAISLAMEGRLEEAEKILDRAVEQGLDTDSIERVRDLISQAGQEKEDADEGQEEEKDPGNSASAEPREDAESEAQPEDSMEVQPEDPTSMEPPENPESAEAAWPEEKYPSWVELSEEERKIWDELFLNIESMDLNSYLELAGYLPDLGRDNLQEKLEEYGCPGLTALSYAGGEVYAEIFDGSWGDGKFGIYESEDGLFLYYGGFTENWERQGDGIWIEMAGPTRPYGFLGSWESDLPNGQGMEAVVVDGEIRSIEGTYREACLEGSDSRVCGLE